MKCGGRIAHIRPIDCRGAGIEGSRLIFAYFKLVIGAIHLHIAEVRSGINADVVGNISCIFCSYGRWRSVGCIFTCPGIKISKFNRTGDKRECEIGVNGEIGCC